MNAASSGPSARRPALIRGVTDRALRSTLEALPSPADIRRARRRRLTLLLAACLAAFISGGVTLAATTGLPGIGAALTAGPPGTSGAPASPTVPAGSLLPPERRSPR